MSNIKNSDKHLTDLNAAAVLKHICTGSAVTRAGIAKATGLTTMTITNIVNRLIEQDIVKELPAVNGEKKAGGRRPAVLDISESSPCIIGVNFTRRGVKIILCDYKAEKLAGHSFLLKDCASADEFIKSITDGCVKIIGGCARRVLAIGISSIGPVDTSTGVILDPPNFNNFKNIPIAHEMRRALGIPVYCMHDTCAAAAAEKWYGAGKGYSDFLYVRIEAGIGAGLVLNNKVYEGANKMSGELGHTSTDFSGEPCVCGGKGCLEGRANTAAIEREVNLAHNFNPPLSFEDIIALYNSKQKLFADKIESFCAYLSGAVINVVNLLDISCVILDYKGQASGHGVEELIEEKVNSAILASQRRHVEILQSSLKNEAALLGAVSVVIDKIFSGEADYS